MGVGPLQKKRAGEVRAIALMVLGRVDQETLGMVYCRRFGDTDKRIPECCKQSAVSHSGGSSGDLIAGNVSCKDYACEVSEGSEDSKGN